MCCAGVDDDVVESLKTKATRIEWSRNGDRLLNIINESQCIIFWSERWMKKKNATLFRHTNTRERCLRTHRVVGRRTSGTRLKIYGLGKSYTLQKTAASLIHRYAAVCNPCLWHGKICVYLNLDFNFENIRGDDATTTRADDDDAERNKKFK